MMSKKIEKEIRWFCKFNGITNYTINQDGSIDVEGDVNLSGRGSSQIPIKFGKVSGNFLYNHNKGAHSLEGCPYEVGGNFKCNHSRLTSLEFAPIKVGSNFICSENDLTSLEFAPIEVGGNFDCSFNKLTTLLGAPSTVGASFRCNSNQLTSLEFAPGTVGRSFSVGYNKLTSLKFSPKAIGGSISCEFNLLTSLEHIPTYNEDCEINCGNNHLPISLHAIVGDLSKSAWHIFIKYHHQFGIWYNGFDEEACKELVEEIRDGLL